MLPHATRDVVVVNYRDDLRWRTCPACKKQRDADTLFTKGRRNCKLCINRAASEKAGRERQLSRLEEVRARESTQSPADKYRDTLINSRQYSDAQIDQFVAREYPTTTHENEEETE